MLAVSIAALVLTVVFVVTQALYLITLVHDLYMLARKVDWVELDEEAVLAGPVPKIVLLYPVLREPQETMRTTFVGLDELLPPRPLPHHRRPEPRRPCHDRRARGAPGRVLLARDA